jgi:tetratricopeptide (TPR) repeat protein
MATPSDREPADTVTIPQLVAAAQAGRLVLFAGAGISLDPPTALPSWWDLSASAVRAIAARAAGVVSDTASLAEVVVTRQRSDRFPPDWVAEKIVHTIGSEYFEVLRCIDSDRPNANHLALAELAATGKLRAVITTNFDRTIEAAFRAGKIAYDVRADTDAVRELLARWPDFEGGQLPCQVIKIHGTADRPDTIIDTLAQRARGTPESYLECVSRLLTFGPWGFVGFSGADLETQPDYLGLARGATHGQGFTWLVQTGTRPRAGVQKLVQVWNGKAEIVEGTLAEVLSTLTGKTLAAEPALVKNAVVDLAEAARSWAEKIPEKRCALIISELVHACGESALSRPALEQIAATYPQHRWKFVSGWSGETLVLKAEDDVGTPLDQPRGFGDRANPAVVALAPKLDQSAADRRNYADALYGLADVLDQLGETAVAVTITERSILAGLYASAGRTHIVRGLGLLADLRAAEGTPAARQMADRLYRTAIRESEIGSLIRPNLMVNSARNATLAGHLPEAFGSLMQAMDEFKKLGDERGRAGVGLALADLSMRVGDLPHALLFWAGVLEFAQRVGDEPMCFEASLGTAKAYLARRDVEKAKPAIQEALRAAKALGDPEREEDVRKALGSLSM